MGAAGSGGSAAAGVGSEAVIPVSTHALRGTASHPWGHIGAPGQEMPPADMGRPLPGTKHLVLAAVTCAGQGSGPGAACRLPGPWACPPPTDATHPVPRIWALRAVGRCARTHDGAVDSRTEEVGWTQREDSERRLESLT